MELKFQKMKGELKILLDQHVDNIERRFKAIPKSRKHTGMLADVQNKLDSSIVFTEKAENIVNEELDKMLTIVNRDYIEDLEQEEADAFVEVARKRLTEVLQNGLMNSFK